ncbi:Limulus clotting factor C, partial [Araneus ventricosus]
CGLTKKTSITRGSYGTNSTAGEFPWMVFLFRNDTRATCGGVLINHRTVLTVAHCLENAAYCTLYFGKYNRSDENDDNEVQMRTSSEIIIHPEFNPLTFDNDIAIVKLSSDVQYSSRIKPICMPSPDSTRINVVPGQKGYVTGWGMNEKRILLSRLMLLTLPVQSPETCMSAYWRRNTFMRITQGMFCAGYTDKKINACDGDSGSPMIFYNIRTQRFTVEGLVSHGTSGRCDKPEKYTIFTRVSHYLRWIYENW